MNRSVLKRRKPERPETGSRERPEIGRVIINADDFGRDKAENSAILAGIQAGSISSTTVMANMPHALDASDIARRGTVSVGLHVNLTEGYPVLDRHEVKTLVGQEGRFLSKRRFLARLCTGGVDLREVYKEVRAQHDRLAHIVRVSHFDSHQNIALVPAVARTVLVALTGVGVTRARSPWFRTITCQSGFRVVGLAKSCSRRVLASRVSRQLAAAGVWTPCEVLGTDYGLTEANGLRLPGVWRSLVVSCEGDWCELCCHPGLYAAERRVLTEPDMVSLLLGPRKRLVSFASWCEQP